MPEKISHIILLTSFGTLGSILTGLIFFGASIFSYESMYFQFVMAGFYGSLFFSLWEYKSGREQIFGIIFILIFQLVISTGRYLALSHIIRDVFYLGSLLLAVKFYHSFLKRNPKLKFYLRAFALAFLYGIINIMLFTIVFLINAKPQFPPLEFIYIIARSGILIGLGIGLGIDIFLQNRDRLAAFFKTKTA